MLAQLVNHNGLSKRIENYKKRIGNHSWMYKAKNEGKLIGYLSRIVSIWWMGATWRRKNQGQQCE